MGRGRSSRVARAWGASLEPCVRTCVCVAVLAAAVCVGMTGAQTAVPPPGVGQVVYSEPQLNRSYRASTVFDPQGMEHLYYVTNLFLDLIQKDTDSSAIDKEQLARAEQEGTLIETLVQLGLYDWRDLIHHHIGYAVLAGAGIVLALLLPVTGLVVCCCRCSGRCGGRVQSYDKKKDGCRRWCLSGTLCVMVVAILFGVVASFVVNEYVERGVTEVPPRLHVAVDDSELYVYNTKQEVNHLLKDNYLELTDVLDRSLEECGVRVERQLAEISEAVAVDNLTAIAEGLTLIRDDLQSLARQSKKLQNKAAQLQVGLQDARAELSVLLRSCSSPGCRQLAARYNLTRLVVHNEFERLPNTSRWLQQVSALIEAGIEAEVRRGQLTLSQLSEGIQTGVAAVVPQVRQSVSRAGIRLQEAAGNLTSALDRLQLQPAHSLIDTADHYLRQYGTFRYYIFVIISGLVSLMVFCLVIGLFCGMCGRRPDNVYGDDTCNKGTGANFLISGTFFYFLFGWLLLLLIVSMFLLGGLSQLYLCDGLADPAAPGSGITILEAVYPLERVLPGIGEADVADIVRRCHRNQSIYSVLRLGRLFNVSEVGDYGRQLGLEETLEQLRQQITVDTAVELLTSRARDQLTQLADSDLDRLNYTAFDDALETAITTVNMTALGDALEAAGRELPPDQRGVATRLRNQAIILKAQQRVVAGMRDIIADIKNSTASLRRHIELPSGPLPEVVRRLTEQAEAAEQYLRTRGSDLVLKLADQFTAQFGARLAGYSTRVETAFRGSLGRCQPVSTVYNSTTVTLCSNVIYPFNAFWASVGWCLLLFLPCVIVSLALTPLYRRAEPFAEGLMDTDYLYDAYGDQDSIPLASVRGSGGGERRRGRSNDLTRGGYSPESPSYSAIPPRGQLYPLGATGADSRDTEPKAPPVWDMTMSGGPPGYPDSPQPGREHPPPYSPSETPMLSHA